MAEQQRNVLLDFLPDFMDALEEQLTEDFKKWGNTWMNRSKLGQEQRIEDDFTNYFDQFEFGGTPVPWLKVVGNAYIAWVREQHSD